MDQDNYFYLPRAYERPEGYEVPPLDQLSADTQHPELNSRNFNYLVNSNYEEPKDFLPVYSLFDMNNGLFIVGTNNFTTATFDGNFIGTEDFDSIVKHDIKRTSFVIPEKSTVTGLKFIDDNLFVTSNMESNMDLWSWKLIHCDNQNNFPFNCGNLKTLGYISYIDRLQNDLKFITASKKGLIDVYDFGLLHITEEFHVALTNTITGISAHPSSPKEWASCSIDRSCLLWDRLNYSWRPSLALRNYENQLTTVYWTKPEENKELLMLGDEIGNVLTLDPRAPHKILQKIRVTNRAISQIRFNGSHRFGVVANNSIISVLEIDPSGELNEIYKHDTAVMNYGMRWDDHDKNSFYVFGEKKHAEKVSVPQ